jgi:hypothetical protein
MVEEIIVGLIVAAVSGVVGFIIKSRLFTKERYLPQLPTAEVKDAYAFVPGRWHEYYYTFDPCFDEPEHLSHAVMDIKLQKNMIIEGECVNEVHHRRALKYGIRGQINSGQLYYTGICVDDPSDAYCAMFKNLLDNRILGVITGWDYEKEAFVSPILLTKEKMDLNQVRELLGKSTLKYFGVLDSNTSAPQKAK